ncbi:MAG TPA: D-alanyl-D-alanine carboxypeptidase family protein [Candidatus Limnocylindrales bacterium]|nr:D-alanyl-D-alanine carboxypeptidase family protein [Candidatus Limnocylindrales bacterium]
MEHETGKVLYERNADFSRYPASLTKIMTLYLAFEALKTGRIKLDTPMKVSEYAAGRDPSKLGLTPGSTLTVEQAIRGMTTKSANDAASVLAEHLAGCEQNFAELMTAKGKVLGMVQTVFYNASGLPAAGHVSSARDLAILSRALIRDFPEYYHFVSLNDFEYRGRHWPNQNRLLRTYFGADGIKTGFIYSSGHNLAASAVRGQNKRLIAIVLGGDTAGWTREHASRLMDIAYAAIDPSLIVVADAKPERAPMEEVTEEEAKPVELPSLAAGNAPSVPVLPSEQGAAAPVAAAAASTELPPAVHSPSPATSMLLTAAAAYQKNPRGQKAAAPAPATAAAGAAVQPGAPAAVAAAPAAAAPVSPASAAATGSAAAPAPVKTATAAPARAATVVTTKSAPAAPAAATATAAATSPAAALKSAVAAPAKSAAVAVAATTAAVKVAATPPSRPGTPASEEPEAAIEQGDGPAAAPAPAAATPAPEGWSVQVGVFRDASMARQRGEEVRVKLPVQLRTAPLLVSSLGTHVSSRFAMVNEKDARQACTELQHGRIPCVVIPPGRPMVVSAR